MIAQEEGCPTSKTVEPSYYLAKLFLKNCMKRKKLDRGKLGEGVSMEIPFDPPMVCFNRYNWDRVYKNINIFCSAQLAYLELNSAKHQSGRCELDI